MRSNTFYRLVHWPCRSGIVDRFNELPALRPVGARAVRRRCLHPIRQVRADAGQHKL